MLCKVDEPYTLSRTLINNYAQTNKAVAFSDAGTKEEVLYTIPSGTKLISCDYTLKIQSEYSQGLGIKIKDGTTEICKYYITDGTTRTDSFTQEVKQWEKVYILFSNNYSGSTTQYYTYDISLYKNEAGYKTWINGKPRELKTLGNMATTTIFWVHIDNTRVTQE